MVTPDPILTTETLLGYHGTSRQRAQLILTEGFKASGNTYDWLGDGAYFWQDAPLRAAEWANDQYGKDAAVVEAIIERRNLINLLDREWMSWLADVHDQYIEELKKASKPIPLQTEGAHRLDRAVINFGVEMLEADGIQIGGVIGVFREGRPVFPNSALYDLSHVQIAVRDLSLIKKCRILPPNEVPNARRLEHP
jgi:hypothetical protein